MSEHTPGPWMVARGVPAAVDAVSGGLVAEAVGGFHRSYEEETANARLIAAAPDMLAELKRLRDVVGDEDASCIDAVIAHAEGQP